MHGTGEMKHIDLFSGIGGFSLACEWAGVETICFCENDKFCQKILKKGFIMGVNSKRCYTSYICYDSNMVIW